MTYNYFKPVSCFVLVKLLKTKLLFFSSSNLDTNLERANMGHIIIDIEEPSKEVSHDNKLSSNSVAYDDNSTMLKELEAEVYQNGFLAGYVFADVSLYQQELKNEQIDDNGVYLNEVERFINQQYLGMMNQVEKTLKRVLKVWEVIQYNIEGRAFQGVLPVHQEMDQVFIILYSIYQQLLPCAEVNQRNIDEVKTKDKELISIVKDQIRGLVKQTFIFNHIGTIVEIVCVSKSLPKMCQTPITFNRSNEVTGEPQPKPLVYDRVKDVYSAPLW